MRFPRYERYRPSYGRWVAELPEHWGLSRLRRLARRFSGGTPDKTRLDYWQDGTIPWLNSGAVNDRIIVEPSAYITADALENSSAKWVPEGALVMALAGQGKTKGMVAQLAFPSTCNQSMAAIIPGAELAPRFLYWWLEANYQNIRNLAGGDLRDGLNLELLGDIPCPIPTIGEQTTIAAVLDSECGRIDTLIVEQAPLIDLLIEKRQAVISHAVTKGLNPNAPMKLSAVEWLGDVPAHWSVLAIKRLSAVKRGASPRPIDDPIYFDDEGEFAWVRISDVTAGGGSLQRTEQRLSALGSSLSVKLSPGQLFLSIAGSVGKPSMTRIQACIHDGFVYFPGLTPDNAAFLYWVFEGGACFGGLGKLGTQLNLNTDTVGAILIALPPPSEMSEIVQYIRRETDRLAALISEAQTSVKLLQERRAALISAAVTGQIDVRGLAAVEVA